LRMGHPWFRDKFAALFAIIIHSCAALIAAR
jgi:hypothetical protein